MTKKTRSGSDSNFGSMVVSSQDKLYNAKTSKTSKKKPRAKSSKKPNNEPPKKKSILLVLLQFIT